MAGHEGFLFGDGPINAKKVQTMGAENQGPG